MSILDSEGNIAEDKIQEVILEVLSGQRIVRLPYAEGSTPSILVLKYPTAAVRQYCEILEEISLERGISDGLPIEGSIDDLMKGAFFSVEDMENLQDLQEKRDAYKALLKKRVKGTEVYLKNEEKLRDIEESIKSLEVKRGQIAEFTAEYQAKEDKYFELLARSSFHVDGYQVWEDAGHLLKTTSTNYAYQLLNKFLDFYWGYPTKVIRKIARSPQWRTMYSASEKGSRLTDICSKDLPISYLHLMSWSMYYQSIQEMLPSDRPSEDVIDDDERLDKFMQEYHIKVKKEADKVKKNKGGKNSKKSSALDKDQVIVTAEANNYVDLHKREEYSDTAIISGRTGEDGGGETTYSEIREKRKKARDRKSARRNRTKNRGGI